MDKRRQAIVLAQHYFRLIAYTAGINWTRNNEAEIEQLVKLIIEAAKDEIRKEQGHE